MMINDFSTQNTDFNNALPEPLSSFDNRSMRWLLAFLPHLGCTYVLTPNQQQRLTQHQQLLYSQRDSSRAPPATETILLPDLNPSEISEVIAHTLNNLQNTNEAIEVIIKAQSDYIIEKDNFEWIDPKNQRLTMFLLINAHSYGIPLIQIVNTGNPEGLRNHLIMRMDLWHTSHNTKIQTLNTMKAKWSDVLSNDRDTKWLSSKDSNQLTWAWKYLKDNHREQNIIQPSDNRELYIAVISSIDSLQHQFPAEKELFLIKMKKRWSQEKYRKSGKAKKQNYFGITIDAEKKIKDLAQRSNLTPSKLVEKLILEEYKRVYNE